MAVSAPKKPKSASAPTAPKKPTSKSKTGNSACSQAASNWQLAIRGKASINPDTYKTLAKCRAMTRTSKNAEGRARAGYNLSDQGANAIKGRLQSRFDRDLVSDKSREAKVKELLAGRAAKQAAPVAKPAAAVATKSAGQAQDDRLRRLGAGTDVEVKRKRDWRQSLVASARNSLIHSREDRASLQQSRDAINYTTRDRELPWMVDGVPITGDPNYRPQIKAPIARYTAARKEKAGQLVKERSERTISKTDRKRAMSIAKRVTKAPSRKQSAPVAKPIPNAEKARQDSYNRRNIPETEKPFRDDYATIMRNNRKNVRIFGIERGDSISGKNTNSQGRRTALAVTQSLGDRVNTRSEFGVENSMTPKSRLRLDEYYVGGANMTGAEAHKNDKGLLQAAKNRSELVKTWNDRPIAVQNSLYRRGITAKQANERQGKASDLLKQRKEKQAAAVVKPVAAPAPAKFSRNGELAPGRELRGRKYAADGLKYFRRAGPEGRVLAQEARRGAKNFFTIYRNDDQHAHGISRGLGARERFLPEKPAPAPPQAEPMAAKPVAAPAPAKFSRNGELAPGRGTESRNRLAATIQKVRKGTIQEVASIADRTAGVKAIVSKYDSSRIAVKDSRQGNWQAFTRYEYAKYIAQPARTSAYLASNKA